MVGMGFGTPYSIAFVDPFDWVHTRAWKRIIRGILGVAIVIGLTIGFDYLIEAYDHSTIFAIKRALPALLFALFSYGLFPLIC